MYLPAPVVGTGVLGMVVGGIVVGMVVGGIGVVTENMVRLLI